MRYSLLTLALATLISTSTLAAFAPAMNQLAATKHSFTNPASPSSALPGPNSGGGKYSICQPCHTPQHAVTDNISSGSWNQMLSTSNYTLYDGPEALDTGQVDSGRRVDRASRLCLGCHDGTIALDAFGTDGAGGRFAGTTAFPSQNITQFGVDFHEDHPVGVVVPVAADTSALRAESHFKIPTITYNTPGDSTSGIRSVSMTVDKEAYYRKLRLFAITGNSDADYYHVGCCTCHNPHGAGDLALTPFPHLLNCKPEYLCTSCHHE